jgi:L-ascorbate metabolism protein UlaG (beta-lactamase superfamily)
MRLTWWGHSTVLLEVEGVRVLTDPLLRDRIGALQRAAPLPAETLADTDTPLDAVLISHLHHDHCDLPSLRRLSPAVVVAPRGAGTWLSRHGVRGVEELRPGELLPLARGVTVTAVHAEHHGRREPWGPFAAPVGHVVEGHSSCVWLAGDTALFPAMSQVARATRAGRVDLAAVPIWGWGPTLGPGHLDPAQAAEAVVRVGAGAAVPVHWGTLHPAGFRRAMHAHLTAPGQLFARELQRRAAARGRPARAHVLRVGESVESVPERVR